MQRISIIAFLLLNITLQTTASSSQWQDFMNELKEYHLVGSWKRISQEPDSYGMFSTTSGRARLEFSYSPPAEVYKLTFWMYNGNYEDDMIYRFEIDDISFPSTFQLTFRVNLERSPEIVRMPNYWHETEGSGSHIDFFTVILDLDLDLTKPYLGFALHNEIEKTIALTMKTSFIKTFGDTVTKDEFVLDVEGQRKNFQSFTITTLVIFFLALIKLVGDTVLISEYQYAFELRNISMISTYMCTIYTFCCYQYFWPAANVLTSGAQFMGFVGALLIIVSELRKSCLLLMKKIVLQSQNFTACIIFVLILAGIIYYALCYTVAYLISGNHFIMGLFSGFLFPQIMKFYYLRDQPSRLIFYGQLSSTVMPFLAAYMNFGPKIYEGYRYSGDVAFISLLLNFIQITLYTLQYQVSARFIAEKNKLLLYYTTLEDAGILDEDLCAICLNNLNYIELEAGRGGNRDKMKIAVAVCNHKFHAACFEDWMKVKQECPTCRRKLRPSAHLRQYGDGFIMEML